MKLSVVMPAYNEEGAIEGVILDHVRILESLALPDWEIVCVDDASSDRTPQLLAALQQRFPRLRVVRHEKNQGIFASFSDCYREARGTHIYATGSDGEWPPENLPRMLERLQAGADLVVGVRTNRDAVYSISRRFISASFNALPRLLLGVPTRDAGSVKLGIRAIFDLELISRSPFFEAERIVKAQRAGFSVAFVPIQFRNRLSGKAGGASWGNIRSSLRDLLLCVKTYGMR